MRRNRLLEIIESVYSILLLLVVGLYILWLAFETALGAPPTWLIALVMSTLIPGGILLLKEGIAFTVKLLQKGDPNARLATKSPQKKESD